MKCVMILFAALMAATACAQTIRQEKVARTAIKAFVAQNYPTAKVKMITDGYSTCRLRFKADGYNYTSIFSLTGAWLETDKRIHPDEAPYNLKGALDTSKYRNGKICTVTEILSAKDHEKGYVFEVKYNKRNPQIDNYDDVVTEVHKLYFTAAGLLAKDEVEPNDALPYLPWGND